MLLSLAYIVLSCGFSSIESTDDLPIGYSRSSVMAATVESSTVNESVTDFFIKYRYKGGSDKLTYATSVSVNNSTDLGTVEVLSIGFKAPMKKSIYQHVSFIANSSNIKFAGAVVWCCDTLGVWHQVGYFQPRVKGSKYYYDFDFTVPYDCTAINIEWWTNHTVLNNQNVFSFSITDFVFEEASSHGWLSGFFDSIIGGIRNIVDGIVNLPSNIANGIKGFFTELGNKITALGDFILDGIKSLFIPAEGYFSSLFDRLNTFFSERFGFLYFPIEHFISWCNRLLTLQDADPYITIPEVKFEGEVFIPAMTYTFDFLDTEPWSTIHNLYLTAIDVALIMSFVQLLQRKYDEVIGK